MGCMEEFQCGLCRDVLICWYCRGEYIFVAWEVAPGGL